MTMQAIEVAFVSEIPHYGYGYTSGLWVPYSKAGYSLYHAQHTFADKRVVQQPFHGVVIDPETKEQQSNQGPHSL